MDSVGEELERLARLRASGDLSDEEYELLKSRFLDAILNESEAEPELELEPEAEAEAEPIKKKKKKKWLLLLLLPVLAGAGIVLSGLNSSSVLKVDTANSADTGIYDYSFMWGPKGSECREALLALGTVGCFELDGPIKQVILEPYNPDGMGSSCLIGNGPFSESDGWSLGGIPPDTEQRLERGETVVFNLGVTMPGGYSGLTVLSCDFLNITLDIDN